MNKNINNKSKLNANKSIINFILILTIIEIVIFFYRLFLPVKIEEINTFKINLAIVLFALSPYIVLTFAYFHKYWMTAFVLKCIVIFTENTKFKFILEVANSIDVNLTIVSRFISILQVLFLLVALILIYKFKGLKKYPKLFNIIKLN